MVSSSCAADIVSSRRRMTMGTTLLGMCIIGGASVGASVDVTVAGSTVVAVAVAVASLDCRVAGVVAVRTDCGEKKRCCRRKSVWAKKSRLMRSNARANGRFSILTKQMKWRKNAHRLIRIRL